jgi:PAS domain S-box-containing protein
MSSATAYAFAMLAVVTAVLLRWLLDPLIGDTLPLVTLFGAVAASVWAGGYRPAVLCAIVGYVACAYLFIEPRGQLVLNDRLTLVGLAAYLFTCSLIVGIGHAMRAAQNRSREQRELLRVTLRSIGDAVVATDVDGRVTYLNAVAESLTGWERHEAQGQPLDKVFRIVNEKTRAPVENPATKALREGIVVGLANHTMLIRKDGVECPIDDSAAPIRDEHGKVSGCVLIFRDVTTQRRTEQDRVAQLHTARLLASIVESSDDAIISKSLDGVIRSWNAAAERLFGYRADEAIGRHISLVIPRDRLAEEDHIIASLKAGQRIDHFETERQKRDGQRIHVSLTVSPLKDDTGNVVGASKIARDITDRKLAEADLRRMAADLSEADKRKDEFLATLAHELRNPLAPLCNMLEVLKRADGDGETLQRARETMDRQLAQLVRLVDDLLDLNRITHNRLELRQSQVALSSFIQQAVEASRPLADAAGHEIVVSLPEEPLYTYADQARLAQVFGNLLNNSCKYTEPGGTIWVTAEREGAEVVISVKDTGSGIPPDKLKSIFDMFTQVEQSPERSGGLGIGLTLVRRLVQMHGGSVEARSAGVGLGSDFVVRLPLLASAVAPEPPVPHVQEPAPVRRILIVDDNSDAAISLALLLTISGNDTHTAHDGVEALEAFERYRPEVILLDIGLPKLSGHEVCRRIRERPDGGDVVIIALTGWGQESDRRMSQDAGFDGHLVKPIDYGAFMDLLRSVEKPVSRVGTNAE